MTGHSPSTDRHAQDDQLCVWCKQPRKSHTPSCPSPPAFLDEKVVVHSLVYRVESVPGTLPPPLLGVGSSLTRRGAGASRSWSVTGSSGSVCRRLRRARSASIWEAVRSQRGMGTGKTSGSLKSYSGAARSTGVVPAADCDTGNHVWARSDGPLFCINCHKRWDNK